MDLHRKKRSCHKQGLLNKLSKGSDSSGRQEFYKNCRKNLAPESCSTTSSFFRRYIGEACSQIEFVPQTLMSGDELFIKSIR